MVGGWDLRGLATLSNGWEPCSVIVVFQECSKFACCCAAFREDSGCMDVVDVGMLAGFVFPGNWDGPLGHGSGGVQNSWPRRCMADVVGRPPQRSQIDPNTRGTSDLGSHAGCQGFRPQTGMGEMCVQEVKQGAGGDNPVPTGLAQNSSCSGCKRPPESPPNLPPTPPPKLFITVHRAARTGKS